MQDLEKELNGAVKRSTFRDQISMAIRDNKCISEVTGLDVEPVGPYVIISPYTGNPYDSEEIRDSGIVVDKGVADYFNPNSGIKEQMQQEICVGKIIAVGRDCKQVRKWSDAVYIKASTVPFPFYD